MKHPIAAMLLAILAILTANTVPLAAQTASGPVRDEIASAGIDWTYTSQHLPLDLKWRRHLESNLRWMIARERIKPENQEPRIVVYADAGTNYQLNGNIVTSLESAGILCRVLDRSRIRPTELQHVEAYIMPGGYSTFQRNALGHRGMQTLRQFVNQGGRFLGICAGGYVASRDVHWEEKHYPYPLELFDGTAEGALDSIAAWPGDAGVSLKLTEAGRLRGLTKEAEGTFYYKGGPHFHAGTKCTVLATYPNGSAAIISRPYGQGEVVLNGIHYERTAPHTRDNDDVPPAPRATGNIFQSLLKMAARTRAAIHQEIDPDITRWVEVTDLAKEDRINLEQNLRWVLTRTTHASYPPPPARIGILADAGVEHASLISIVTLLESHGIKITPLLHTDVNEHGLKPLDVLVIPAGNHRILRDTLGDQGQQAISKFIKSGKQYIGVSTGAYLAARTIRWQQRTWEYPLKYYWGMAQGPLAELAIWPAVAQVDLQPTAEGLQRGLTKTLLATCQYHGGPRFVNGRDHQVLANYPDKSAAIVSKKIGGGEVLLIGVEVSPAATGKTGSQFLLNLLRNP
ncbi:MAG: hypothetical protein GY917_00365 [Planctomycetaceae bacterium]|nr:hypothetical protein [Planctomycetaceae bacterium]MCP4504941.1 hypothetical protein [Fuerstiella sp.]